MVYGIKIMVILILNASWMQIGQVLKLIEDLLRVIVFLLGETWCHGKVKQNVVSCSVLNQNIEPWHNPHVNFYGYNNCSMRLVLVVHYL